jgi:hypothetical protein
MILTDATLENFLQDVLGKGMALSLNRNGAPHTMTFTINVSLPLILLLLPLIRDIRFDLQWRRK